MTGEQLGSQVHHEVHLWCTNARHACAGCRFFAAATAQPSSEPAPTPSCAVPPAAALHRSGSRSSAGGATTAARSQRSSVSGGGAAVARPGGRSATAPATAGDPRQWSASGASGTLRPRASAEPAVAAVVRGAAGGRTCGPLGRPVKGSAATGACGFPTCAPPTCAPQLLEHATLWLNAVLARMQRTHLAGIAQRCTEASFPHFDPSGRLRLSLAAEGGYIWWHACSLEVVHSPAVRAGLCLSPKA